METDNGNMIKMLKNRRGGVTYMVHKDVINQMKQSEVAWYEWLNGGEERAKKLILSRFIEEYNKRRLENQ